MKLLNKSVYERKLKKQHELAKVRTRKKINSRTRAAKEKKPKRKPNPKPVDKIGRLAAAAILVKNLRQKITQLKKTTEDWKLLERQALVSFCQGQIVYAKEIGVINADKESEYLTFLGEAAAYNTSSNTRKKK